MHTHTYSERKKHEQIISELERKTNQEKDRLRRDMEAKIREVVYIHICLYVCMYVCIYIYMMWKLYICTNKGKHINV